jgi:hypothetical protein
MYYVSNYNGVFWSGHYNGLVTEVLQIYKQLYIPSERTGRLFRGYILQLSLSADQCGKAFYVHESMINIKTLLVVQALLCKIRHWRQNDTSAWSKLNPKNVN